MSPEEKVLAELDARFLKLGAAGHDLYVGQQVSIDYTKGMQVTAASCYGDVGGWMGENVEAGCQLAQDIYTGEVFAVTA